VFRPQVLLGWSSALLWASALRASEETTAGGLAVSIGRDRDAHRYAHGYADSWREARHDERDGPARGPSQKDQDIRRVRGHLRILHSYEAVSSHRNVTPLRYHGRMGRPRLHDERTSHSLLDAAESLIAGEAVESLSVRRLAEAAGTSTRAIYSLFGSREGLLDALGARAFDWLTRELDAQPSTADCRDDLIAAGAGAFRRLVTERPQLARVALQRPKASPGTLTYRAGEQTSARLLSRIQRLQEAGLLAGRSPEEAAWQYHALCEGLAALELRGAIPPDESERTWRAALGTMVDGLLFGHGARSSYSSS